MRDAIPKSTNKNTIVLTRPSPSAMIPFAAPSRARRLFENQSQNQLNRPDGSPDSTALARNPALADGSERRAPVTNLAGIVVRRVWRVVKRGSRVAKRGANGLRFSPNPLKTSTIWVRSALPQSTGHRLGPASLIFRLIPPVCFPNSMFSRWNRRVKSLEKRDLVSQSSKVDGETAKRRPSGSSMAIRFIRHSEIHH